MNGKTHFECSNPILRVEDMAAAVRYYTEVLGMKAAGWGDENFTCVSRNEAAIYLCRGGQGRGCAWAWVGVEDVAALYEEYRASGAKIVREPKNYPWALEMLVEDTDGNVLRFGSDSIKDRPYDKP